MVKAKRPVFAKRPREHRYEPGSPQSASKKGGIVGNNENKDKQQSWHIGKEIPIALVFAILLQTAGGMWWAATVTTKLNELTYQVAAIDADRYTKSDAQKDGALYAMEIADLNRRLQALERK